MSMRKGSCIEALDSASVKRVPHVRLLSYFGALVGVGLLLALAVHTDFQALSRLWPLAGWPLLWLVPYRGLYFFLFAFAWRPLLKTYENFGRLSIGYLWWVSALREAIDRLLPVASVGGAIVGVRLLAWRGISRVQVGASVIVEVILTLAASYLFAALSVILLLKLTVVTSEQSQILAALAMSLPVPVACFVLLRYGSWFARLESLLGATVGFDVSAKRGAILDLELRGALSRTGVLLEAGLLQFAGMVSASFEFWLVLRLFGHPVDALTAFVLEGATQAVRHLAFFIPGGLGAQEAGIVLLGQPFGIDAELAIAVSLAKRLREVLCGFPALMAWQWQEARRLRQAADMVSR
jgi:putative membrane protein